MEGWKKHMNINAIMNEAGTTLFNTDISLTRISIVLFFALFFGVYIFLIYRKTSKNEFYSKDFNTSLIIVCIITSSIILAIQSNLVISLGMVGALSIVRFRTAIKSTYDLVFLYWSISIGIVCGASLFMLASIMSAIVTVSLFVTKKIETPISLQMLVVHTNNINNIEEIMELIKTNTSFLKLKNKTISEKNIELIFEYKATNKNLDHVLNNSELVNSYSVINYDRDNKI